MQLMSVSVSKTCSFTGVKLDTPHSVYTPFAWAPGKRSIQWMRSERPYSRTNKCAVYLSRKQSVREVLILTDVCQVAFDFTLTLETQLHLWTAEASMRTNVVGALATYAGVTGELHIPCTSDSDL